MRKSISLQKVTKFIVDGWLGDGPDWKKHRPQAENQHAQPHATPSFVPSKSGKPRQQKSLPQLTPAGRHGFGENAENSDQYHAINELTEVHVTKTAYVSLTLLKHERHSQALNAAMLRLESDFDDCLH
jgi:hypothetical protein